MYQRNVQHREHVTLLFRSRPSPLRTRCSASALLVHAQRLTGSFAAAGVVTAAYGCRARRRRSAARRPPDRRGQIRGAARQRGCGGQRPGRCRCAAGRRRRSCCVRPSPRRSGQRPPVGAARRRDASWTGRRRRGRRRRRGHRERVSPSSPAAARAAGGTAWVDGHRARRRRGAARRRHRRVRRPGAVARLAGRAVWRGWIAVAPGVDLAFVFVAVGVVFGAVEVGVAAAASSAACSLLGDLARGRSPAGDGGRRIGTAPRGPAGGAGGRAPGAVRRRGSVLASAPCRALPR